MSDGEGLDYASSGVDIDLEAASVASLIGALSKSVRKSGTPGAPVDLPGGFGGLVEFGDNLLALATDGVGSKLQIANELEQLAGVGIDCMAMNVNDLLCVGAEPIAFVDYVAIPKPDPAVHAALGASLSSAAARARVTLAGGETASLPGIVKELDLSGTALGWLPKDEAITGENMQAGDALIGLPSSGIHSNGFSLVRAVLEKTGADIRHPAPFSVDENRIERFTTGEVTLGEVLLNPTQIYCDPVYDLIAACPAYTEILQAAVREIVGWWCEGNHVPVAHQHDFVDRLRVQWGALGNTTADVAIAAQRVWTSQHKHLPPADAADAADAYGSGTEFCSMFGAAMRADRATLAEAVATVARALNANNVGRVAPDLVVFPQGPHAADPQLLVDDGAHAGGAHHVAVPRAAFFFANIPKFLSA